jgi:hypothetical protein
MSRTIADPNARNTTVTTTLRVEEVAAIKKTGLKYNQLLRMGLRAATGDNVKEMQTRLERLEKGLDSYRTRYFDVKRDLLQLQEKKEGEQQPGGDE